ncbi:MAG: 2-amino-4-hydroxy-6-hydroxymethyldihydropteridine diphosphokinase [Phycisphaerales bacterium]|jgi:2-amino-4-hydroxy-6-hydroxymethyldihydropteridine diphosphokinase|nr:2-amino-4-hydroxy-6-hydroxymethyldihydropteridine diphosphokinase [Phycisphaerales bacterium]
MKQQNVFLGLGSNLGDRAKYLATAVDSICKDPNILVVQQSSVIETEPVGIIEQGKFLNQVIEIQTEYEPLDLLSACLAIEASLGRVRDEKWGPRILDIDILFYGCHSINEEDLIIPHPKAHKRLFVLIPMEEIAPNFEHPIEKQRISTMLHAL